MNRRELQKSMKWFVLPQYLVEPQYIEGYVEGRWTVYRMPHGLLILKSERHLRDVDAEIAMGSEPASLH